MAGRPSKLIAIHALTRPDSFGRIKEHGRILPFEMRVNPSEIVGECLEDLGSNWLNQPDFNPASVKAYEELLDEYKSYLETIPRWYAPMDISTHTYCVELISGDGEFVFLSFMKPHPWIKDPSGMFFFDAVDLIEKGARVRKIAGAMNKFFHEWLYEPRRWTVEYAKERLLYLYSWSRGHEMEGEKALRYLERMKDSENVGFIQILWKGPLPVNWSTVAYDGSRLLVTA